MQKLILTITLIMLFVTNCFSQGYQKDTFESEKGRKIDITFIKHATLMIEVDDFVIHIDPVSMFGTDYNSMPKADMIIVGHEHGDHYDSKAIDTIYKDGTIFLSSPEVSKLNPKAQAFTIGESYEVNGIKFTAFPAYNCSEGHTNFHPKTRGDIGVLIDIDNYRIYIAGDTENIPEMANLSEKQAGRKVDIAFLPVNQPYTMTVEQCIEAINAIQPRIVYPYHYGQTDLSPLKEVKNTEIIIREMQ